MNTITGIWNWVSKEEIWLPQNITWQDVASTPNYPRAHDLYHAVFVAVLLAALRRFFERYVFVPIGEAFKVWVMPNCPEKHSALEKAFEKNSIEGKQMKVLSKELNWTVRQIEHWIRRKRNAILKMKKFNESAWHVTFYSAAVIYGYLTVWDKSWKTNISECFPEALSDRVVDDQIRWYYLIELGFYLSLIATIFHDVRRKDFAIMVFHHVYTLILISVSWLTSTSYIGCLVMFLHDVGDVPLGLYKLFQYMKKDLLSNASFVVFLFVWCLSRLAYFPFLIVGGVTYSATYLSPFCYYLLNGLMVALFGLHLLWTWMIIRILFKLLTTKEAVDVRSEDEANTTETEDVKKKL